MTEGAAGDDPEIPGERLFVVVGPTASGKTELAVTLAETIGAEIVSADSVQVYRHFDIGTGKPTAEERARAPHHLIDIAEPEQPLDAARWAELADRAISEIRARGRRVIVCGGSFLWVRALIRGLAPAPPADPEVRARHRKLVEDEGAAVLHARLSEVDPESASRLAPADTTRVSRALEVYELSGVPQSQLHADHGFRTERHRATLIGPVRTREELDQRIAARVESMLERGWIEEVRGLRDRGLGETRAMSAVGYRQIAEALAGEVVDRDALLTSIVRATRVFARRQRTWLRDEDVRWVSGSEELTERELEA